MPTRLPQQRGGEAALPDRHAREPTEFTERRIDEKLDHSTHDLDCEPIPPAPQR